MSFFGFDTSGRSHNQTAPGFSQTHDPFAGLSGADAGDDEALEFEDTYDGLGDQLDDADDAFNEDTFGGDVVAKDGQARKVGTDFDFFGQTAKVADAIEEEGVRFSRQVPAPRAPVYNNQPEDPYRASSYYDYAQPAQRPMRTGYEKYKDSEPIPDLQVDQSIWGTAPKAVALPVSQPPPQTAASAASRKIMSLEEVEAAMRSQSRQPAQSQPPPHQQPLPQEPPFQPQSSPLPPNSQQYQQAQPGQGHPPVTILQRPQSSQVPPAPLSQSVPTPQTQGVQQPKQILQNPNRGGGGVDPGRAAGHQPTLSQGDVARALHGQAHPQLNGMTEEERAAYLDQETKRAKRNHKIWLLSKDNGLMTPQDKNFITRIQLQQLVTATGDPAQAGTDAALSEDFYYQVYSHIRAGQRQNPSQPLSNFAQTYLFQTGGRHGMRRHERRADNHFQRMEQQVQRAVEAAKSKPKNPQLVIAGSLGKISFSNAKTPKPLLNIKRTENEVKPNTGRQSPPKATLDRKTILRNVEKVYNTLMKIENHVRQIPAPLHEHSTVEDGEKHQEWAAVLEAYNSKLWNELKVHEEIGQTVPHPFIAFLSCAKGKKAIPRIFPHLSFKQRTTILTMIIYHLDQLDVVKGGIVQDGIPLNAETRENIELFISVVMPSLMGYFTETGLDIVDAILNLIATQLNVELISKTRIGISMLTLILSRAMVVKQGGGGSPEQWEKWDQTFESLFNRLEPSLPHIFPGSINSGNDVYVWQLLAAMGVTASHDQQTRLVLSVKDRVLDTVALSKTLPPAMATERLSSVNLFMRAIGLDVELLE